MDLSKWIEKARELPGKIKEAPKAFAAVFGKAHALLPKIPHRSSTEPGFPSDKASLKDRLQRIFGSIHIPTGKRRHMLFIVGGLAALFLVVAITAVLAVNSRRPGGGASVDMGAGPVIPPEELFLPSEPDFLPELLLEREPRQSWSLEDIRPYWKNPEYPELWREVIKSAVDELMEDVP